MSFFVRLNIEQWKWEALSFIVLQMILNHTLLANSHGRWSLSLKWRGKGISFPFYYDPYVFLNDRHYLKYSSDLTREKKNIPATKEIIFIDKYFQVRFVWFWSVDPLERLSGCGQHSPFLSSVLSLNIKLRFRVISSCKGNWNSKMEFYIAERDSSEWIEKIKEGG